MLMYLASAVVGKFACVTLDEIGFDRDGQLECSIPTCIYFQLIHRQ